jgi:hypothetical protein
VLSMKKTYTPVMGGCIRNSLQPAYGDIEGHNALSLTACKAGCCRGADRSEPVDTLGTRLCYR